MRDRSIGRSTAFYLNFYLIVVSCSPTILDWSVDLFIAQSTLSPLPPPHDDLDLNTSASSSTTTNNNLISRSLLALSQEQAESIIHAFFSGKGEESKRAVGVLSGKSGSGLEANDILLRTKEQQGPFTSVEQVGSERGMWNLRLKLIYTISYLTSSSLFTPSPPTTNWSWTSLSGARAEFARAAALCCHRVGFSVSNWEC